MKEVRGTPRVLIVDDHKVLAETLVLALRMNGLAEVVAVDDLSVPSVVSRAEEFRPQVAILDLPFGDAGSALSLIRSLSTSGINVLVLTPTRDRGDLLAECLEAGAAGLFDKGNSFDHLLALIQDAAAGVTVLQPSARQDLLAALREHREENEARMRPFALLSTREREVLMSLTRGRSAEEIATDQFVSIATIRSQIRGILLKLGVNSQLAAVALARQADWGRIGS